MTGDVQYPDVHVQLTGKNGNAWVIIGEVAAAIRREAGTEAEQAFATAATSCGSYEELLRLCMRTVNVS